MYINIHSHNAALNNNQLVIQSKYGGFENMLSNAVYSIGIHPWFINPANIDFQLECLKKYAGNKNVKAIGECGLDKVCSTNYSLQKQVFVAQIQLANSLKLPLVLHCVKAYDDVLFLLKINENKVPVIFHGFNKNVELATKLINERHYLSIGKAIMKPHVQALITKISVEHIFLETDDATITIEEIYKKAANVLNISELELQLQIKKNIAIVFGDGLITV